MRQRILWLIGFFFAVFLMLSITYPIWRSVELDLYSATLLIQAYSTLSLTVSLICLELIPLLIRALKVPYAILRTSLVGIASGGLLMFYSITIGNLSAGDISSLPFSYMHAKFFRNYMSIKFAFINSPLIAVMAALMFYMRERSAQRKTQPASTAV